MPLPVSRMVALAGLGWACRRPPREGGLEEGAPPGGGARASSKEQVGQVRVGDEALGQDCPEGGGHGTGGRVQTEQISGCSRLRPGSCAVHGEARAAGQEGAGPAKLAILEGEGAVLLGAG